MIIAAICSLLLQKLQLQIRFAKTFSSSDLSSHVCSSSLLRFVNTQLYFHSREIGAKYHSAKHKQAGVQACGHLIL